MHGCRRVRVRVIEQKRHAVGDKHRDGDAGLSHDQPIGRGDAVLEALSSRPHLGGIEHVNGVAVHLLAERERFGWQTSGLTGAPTVLDHSFGIVAHVEAEVQLRVGSLAHPTPSRSDPVGEPIAA